MIDVSRAADQWRSEGLALIEGLISPEEMRAVQAELPTRNVDPPRLRGPLRRPDADRPDDDRPDDDRPDDDRPDADQPGASEPAFREEQFSGTVLFPLPAAPNINRLFVQPEIVAFAERAWYRRPPHLPVEDLVEVR